MCLLVGTILCTYLLVVSVCAYVCFQQQPTYVFSSKDGTRTYGYYYVSRCFFFVFFLNGTIRTYVLYTVNEK